MVAVVHVEDAPIGQEGWHVDEGVSNAVAIHVIKPCHGSLGVEHWRVLDHIVKECKILLDGETVDFAFSNGYHGATDVWVRILTHFQTRHSLACKRH